MQPDDIQGLLSFQQSFDQNPVQTWLNLFELLKNDGAIQTEADVNALQTMLSGQSPEPEAPQEEQSGGDMPPWAQQLAEGQQQLAQRLDAREQQENITQQDQQLQTVLDQMESQLDESGVTFDGWDEDDVEALMMSTLITTDGDPDRALSLITNFRQGQLKGFTEEAKSRAEGRELEMPRGAPNAPKRSPSGNNWDTANKGAAQMLQQRINAQAQEE
jgi:hypothetical protein